MQLIKSFRKKNFQKTIRFAERLFGTLRVYFMVYIYQNVSYFQVEAIKIEVETFAKEVETEKIIAVQSADELVRWEEEVKKFFSKVKIL